MTGEFQPTTKDWQRLRGESGRRLPSDFMTFVSKKGRASDANFIWYFNPADPDEGFNFSCADELHRTYEELRKEFGPDEFLYSRNSEEGDFQFFARTDNGDTFAFVYSSTDELPESIVVFEHGFYPLGVFKLSFTKFREQMLSGQILEEFDLDGDWLKL